MWSKMDSKWNKISHFIGFWKVGWSESFPLFPPHTLFFFFFFQKSVFPPQALNSGPPQLMFTLEIINDSIFFSKDKGIIHSWCVCVNDNSKIHVVTIYQDSFFKSTYQQINLKEYAKEGAIFSRRKEIAITLCKIDTLPFYM